MNEPVSNNELSKYNKYILNKILPYFKADHELNIYSLVEEAVLHKCILPSQNELVMETYYNIKEYLETHGFIVEIKEMTSYALTSKGLQLKACGSWESYEGGVLKKNKKSFLHLLFKGRAKHTSDLYDNNLAPEHYE